MVIEDYHAHPRRSQERDLVMAVRSVVEQHDGLAILVAEILGDTVRCAVAVDISLGNSPDMIRAGLGQSGGELSDRGDAINIIVPYDTDCFPCAYGADDSGDSNVEVFHQRGVRKRHLSRLR